MTAGSTSLLSEVIAAHGGLERWLATTDLTVDASAGGLAFASKFQLRALQGPKVNISTDHQRAVFTPYPRPGYRGVLERGEVRVETSEGRIVRARPDAGAAVRSRRRLLWWDALDIFYFGASSLWTYIAMPYMLADPGFSVEEGASWTERGEEWRTLAVTFPPEIDTHSRQQTVYIGEDGLIRRHDYIAEEFGRWARSAHYWFDYHVFDGFAVPRKRRVYPRRGDNQARRRPVLVWVDVNNISRQPAESSR